MGQVYNVAETSTGHFKIKNVVDGNFQAALDNFGYNPNYVKSLDLSGNVLSNINGNAFSKFTNLLELKLATNVLTGEMDVSRLTKLVTLDINNNYINRVTLGPSVKNFNAVRNNITGVNCIRPQWGNQQSKKFNLISNKINQLADLAPECRKGLEELNLELNDIDIIDFADLSDSQQTLKILNLRYNFIYDVKNTKNVAFSQLSNLDLEKNKIAFMSSALNAASRAHIDLSNNKLVLIDDKLNIQLVPSLNLTGNEFQCQTLQKFMKKHTKYTPSRPEECGNKKNEKGICCEDLSAPFADRLIALKRRENSLFAQGNTEEDQKQCEQENQEREKLLSAILDEYNTQVDKAVRQKQEQARLNVEKNNLQTKLNEKQEILDKLIDLLKVEASSVKVTFTGDTINTIDDIVQYYETRYNNEQNKQRQAIRDLESYQKMIEQQLEEKERLEKLNLDADTALNNANATLTALKTKQAELTKVLADRNAQNTQ